MYTISPCWRVRQTCLFADCRRFDCIVIDVIVIGFVKTVSCQIDTIWILDSYIISINIVVVGLSKQDSCTFPGHVHIACKGGFKYIVMDIAIAGTYQKGRITVCTCRICIAVEYIHMIWIDYINAGVLFKIYCKP